MVRTVYKSLYRNVKVAGFTLLELIVCISIFALITAVVIYRYGDFNNNLVMTNQAYEVSLAVRQAQVYGLSVREFGANFSSGYGVRVVRGGNEIMTFVDANNNGVYDGTSSPDQVVEAFSLGLGTVVDDFCIPSGQTDVCSAIDTLDITFRRPNPEAIIYGDGTPGAGQYSYAKIILMARNGVTREVVVRATGQISVVVPPVN